MRFAEEMEILGDKPFSVWAIQNQLELQKINMMDAIMEAFISSYTRGRWKRQLEKENCDAIVAGLLSRLPRLQVLRLGYALWVDSRFLRPMPDERQNGRHNQFLRRVKLLVTPEVGGRTLGPDGCWNHLQSVCGPVAFDVGLVQTLFTLPQIEYIACSVPELEDSQCQRMTGAQREALTQLTLTRSELKLRNLKHLLSATPRLKVLHYENPIFVRTDRVMGQYFECDDGCSNQSTTSRRA